MSDSEKKWTSGPVRGRELGEGGAQEGGVTGGHGDSWWVDDTFSGWW